MLNNVLSLMTPRSLRALANIGRGDEVAVFGAHFLAASLAERGGARPVRSIGADWSLALSASMQMRALNDFGSCAARTMQAVGEARAVPAAVAEFTEVLEAGEEPAVALEHTNLYRRGQSAFGILRTGGTRGYGNILFRKGMVSSDPR